MIEGSTFITTADFPRFAVPLHLGTKVTTPRILKDRIHVHPDSEHDSRPVGK
jgi:hypothetical protein